MTEDDDDVEDPTRERATQGEYRCTETNDNAEETADEQRRTRRPKTKERGMQGKRREMVVEWKLMAISVAWRGRKGGGRVRSSGAGGSSGWAGGADTWLNLIGKRLLKEKKHVSETMRFINTSVAVRPRKLAIGSKQSNGHARMSSSYSSIAANLDAKYIGRKGQNSTI